MRSIRPIVSILSTLDSVGARLQIHLRFFLNLMLLSASTSAFAKSSGPAWDYIDQKILKPLCERGEKRACLLSKDTLQGLSHFQCTSSGDIRCALMLGAQGLRLNNSMEANWNFSLACSQGESHACIATGWLAVEEQSLIRAKMFFLKACENSAAEGCLQLANLEAQAGNSPESRRLLELACEYGNSIGCSTRAERSLSSGNIPGAIYFFRLACEKGQSASCKQVQELSRAPASTE